MLAENRKQLGRAPFPLGREWGGGASGGGGGSGLGCISFSRNLGVVELMMRLRYRPSCDTIVLLLRMQLAEPVHLPPLRQCKIYLNLTNGIEALPRLQQHGLPFRCSNSWPWCLLVPKLPCCDEGAGTILALPPPAALSASRAPPVSSSSLRGWSTTWMPTSCSTWHWATGEATASCGWVLLSARQALG